jgi:hypothetical protein
MTSRSGKARSRLRWRRLHRFEQGALSRRGGAAQKKIVTHYHELNELAVLPAVETFRMQTVRSSLQCAMDGAGPRVAQELDEEEPVVKHRIVPGPSSDSHGLANCEAGRLLVGCDRLSGAGRCDFARPTMNCRRVCGVKDELRFRCGASGRRDGLVCSSNDARQETGF